MANPEHLARLAEGVESWNAWRRENLSVEPDLSAADLRGRNLAQVYLRLADLRQRIRRDHLPHPLLFAL